MQYSLVEKAHCGGYFAMEDILHLIGLVRYYKCNMNKILQYLKCNANINKQMSYIVTYIVPMVQLLLVFTYI